MSALYALPRADEPRAGHAVTDDRGSYDAEPERGQFAAFPFASIDRLAGDGDGQLVLLALYRFSNRNGECWPSVPTIAKQIGRSERQVRYTINRLVGLGLISKELKSVGGVNVYRLANPCTPCITPAHHAGGTAPDAGGGLHTMQGTPAHHADRTRTSELEPIEPEPKNVKPPTPSTPKAKKPLPENGPEQQMVAAFCRAAGIERPAIYPKAIGNAKQLIAAGVTIDDVPALYAFTASIWKGGADLGNMVLSVDRWRANNGAPTAPQNGHRKLSVSEQNAMVRAKLLAEAEAAQHGGEVIDAYAEVRR